MTPVQRAYAGTPGGHPSIAMDTPGFGQSDAPPRPAPGLDWYASRVRDLFDPKAKR